MVYGNRFLNESDMSLLVLEQELDNFELLTEGFGDKVKEIFGKIAELFKKIIGVIKEKVLGAINTIKAKIFSKFTSSFIKGVTDKLEKEIGTTDFEIDLGEATSDDDEFEDESALIYTNEVVETIALGIAKKYLNRYIGKLITKNLFFDFDKYIKYIGLENKIATIKNLSIRVIHLIDDAVLILSKDGNISNEEEKKVYDDLFKTIDEIYRFLGSIELFGKKFTEIIDKDLYKDIRNGAKKWFENESEEQYDRMVNAGKISYNKLKSLAIDKMDPKDYDKLVSMINFLIKISEDIVEKLEIMIDKLPDTDEMNKKIISNLSKLLGFFRKYFSATLVIVEEGVKYSAEQKRQASAIVNGFEKTVLGLVSQKNQDKLKKVTNKNKEYNNVDGQDVLNQVRQQYLSNMKNKSKENVYA